MTTPNIPIQRCARCGVALDNPAREFYPLWFITRDGLPICPNCVPGRAVTATLTFIDARAVLPPLPSPNSIGAPRSA